MYSHNRIPFNKYLLKIYYVSGTVLGAGEITNSKQKQMTYRVTEEFICSCCQKSDQVNCLCHGI